VALFGTKHQWSRDQEKRRRAFFSHQERPLPHCHTTPTTNPVLLEKVTMTVIVELDLPKDWRRFKLPPALDHRLQELLDRQDRAGKLSAQERREAGALAELVDLLSVMRLRATLATKKRKP